MFQRINAEQNKMQNEKNFISSFSWMIFMRQNMCIVYAAKLFRCVPLKCVLSILYLCEVMRRSIQKIVNPKAMYKRSDNKCRAKQDAKLKELY